MPHPVSWSDLGPCPPLKVSRSLTLCQVLHTHTQPHHFLLKAGPIFQGEKGGPERLSHWFKDKQEEKCRVDI